MVSGPTGKENDFSDLEGPARPPTLPSLTPDLAPRGGQGSRAGVRGGTGVGAHTNDKQWQERKERMEAGRMVREVSEAHVLPEARTCLEPRATRVRVIMNSARAVT